MALNKALREWNRGQCVLMAGAMMRRGCQKRSGALGPVPWGWIMMEAKVARGLHEDLNVPGNEKETMGSCKSKMWWEYSYGGGGPTDSFEYLNFFLTFWVNFVNVPLSHYVLSKK